MILPNNSLHLPMVDDSSEAWYICQAENEGGVTRERIFLKVSQQGHAQFLYSMSKETHRYGELEVGFSFANWLESLSTLIGVLVS